MSVGFQESGSTPATDRNTGQERRTLTMDEACKVIGLPRSTGYELAASGRFPCRVLRIGGRWYVPTDAVEELLSGRAA